jgi:hypothetical protein
MENETQVGVINVAPSVERAGIRDGVVARLDTSTGPPRRLHSAQAD